MHVGWDSAYVLVVDLSGISSREDLNPFDRCSEQITPFFQLLEKPIRKNIMEQFEF